MLRKIGIGLLCFTLLAAGIWRGAGPRHSTVALVAGVSEIVNDAAGVAGASDKPAPAPAGGADQTSSAAPMTTGRPVIVIDAGHGSPDGGAVAADGTLEQDINLSIAKELEQIVRQYPADVIMTRTDDAGLSTAASQTLRQKKREDLQRRTEILEQSGATLGISIHLNSFPQNVKVCGPQVFYPKDQEGKTNVRGQKFLSSTFAKNVQKALELNLPDGRERKAMAKDDILMFQNASMDLILVECGFLSNPEELKKLQTAEYQHLLAISIWEGVNETLCLAPLQKLKIIDSANRGQIWK